MRLLSCSKIMLLATMSLGLVACGGGDDDDTTIIPEGDHHHYVVDSVTIPLNSSQAEDLGFDLDGDGTVDNQLGNILSALIQAGGGGSLDLQGSIDESVDAGEILLLADVQATSLSSAANVGFSLFLGANPTPAACTDPDDPLTCRQHLDGNGSFDIDPATPDDVVVGGNIVGGTFNGGPGDLALQIALDAGNPINLRLIEARARLTGIATDGIDDAIIGGAIPQEDIDNEVIPAVHGTVTDIIAEDCTGSGADCGCMADSTGLTLLGIFDDNEDCAVPLAELQENSLIMTLLRSDVDTDGDGEEDALSVGVGATAVAGTFDQP